MNKRRWKRFRINGRGNVICQLKCKTVNVKNDCMNCNSLFGIVESRYVNCKNEVN